jgi:uncharacterized damage-inducible protein DinB
MNWTDLLKAELASAYAVTDNLMALVEEADLPWKPATGSNWMTTGQLLKHLTEGCGMPFRGFITGDWGVPEGTDLSGLPTAEQLPAVASVAEARQLLAEDKARAFAALATVDEDALSSRDAPAPWDPSGMKLGPRLLQMVHHLEQHKGQLFYYLKLQGKPVNTAHLWGG